jgi:hypothetical protein
MYYLLILHLPNHLNQQLLERDLLDVLLYRHQLM